MNEITQKKTKFRFNFIDVLLLLIIVAAGLLLYTILKPSDNTDANAGTEQRTIMYVIEMRETYAEFKGNVNIGDSVVDSVGLYPIGEVVDVTYSDSTYTYKADGEGKVIYSTYPDRIDIAIKIKATASVSSGRYSIGGYEVAVGENVNFRLPNLTGSSYCISIEDVTD